MIAANEDGVFGAGPTTEFTDCGDMFLNQSDVMAFVVAFPKLAFVMRNVDDEHQETI